jgi:2-amino-4-hydroxy-6-hydroxymethyldihydropteridine diphosphokinase
VPEVLIALGSNLGDRLKLMQQALDRLGTSIHWEVVSGVYETEPMYVEDQPAYLNAAARGTTELGPLALLDLLKSVEREVGRHAGERYGPREIDLDLIAYGCLHLSSRRPGRKLTVPHPKTVERRFVLAPLADVAPEWALAGLGRVDELLAATKAQAEDVIILSNAVLSVRGHGPSR